MKDKISFEIDADVKEQALRVCNNNGINLNDYLSSCIKKLVDKNNTNVVNSTSKYMSLDEINEVIVEIRK